jgi:hypothetical protein
VVAGTRDLRSSRGRCTKPDRYIRSDTDRRPEEECKETRFRRSSVARRSRCRCRLVSRTPAFRRYRPRHPQNRRVRWCRRHRRPGRPSPSFHRDHRCLPCPPRLLSQTRPLRHPAGDRRRRGSRQRSRRLSRARSPDTRPDSARTLPCRHLRRVHLSIPRRHRYRLRVRPRRLCRLLRQHSIRRRRRSRFAGSIHTLRPPATIEDQRSTA